MKQLCKNTIAIAIGVALVAPVLMAGPSNVTGTLAGFSANAQGGPGAGEWGIPQSADRSSAGQSAAGEGKGADAGGYGGQGNNNGNGQNSQSGGGQNAAGQGKGPDAGGHGGDTGAGQRGPGEQSGSGQGEHANDGPTKNNSNNPDGNGSGQGEHANDGPTKNNSNNPDGDGSGSAQGEHGGGSSGSGNGSGNSSGSSSSSSGSSSGSSGGSSGGSGSNGGGDFPPLDPPADGPYDPNNDGDNQIPSGCAEGGSACEQCVQHNEGIVQFNRRYLHVAWATTHQTLEYTKQAIAFGDGVSEMSKSSLSWQLTGKPQIIEAVQSLRKTYDSKYHIYINNMEQALNELKRCETDNVAISDLYSQFSMLYLEFVTARYASPD
jgi:hypothetical protein